MLKSDVAHKYRNCLIMANVVIANVVMGNVLMGIDVVPAFRTAIR